MVVIDLETYRMDGAEAYLDQPKPDKRLKDPEKIAADIAEKTTEQLAKLALNPYTARIVALGRCEEGDEVAHVDLAPTEAAEVSMLRDFWARVVVDSRIGAVVPLVTFNGLKFDLPMLVVRSRLLGVRAPQINIDRYRSPHPDVLSLLTFNGVLDYRSLRFFAKRFGLNTDDAFAGSEIAELVDAGDWESIRRHCASDVLLTRQLAERIGLMKPLVRAA